MYQYLPVVSFTKLKTLSLISLLVLSLSSCSLNAIPKVAVNSTGAVVGASVGVLVGQPALGAAIGAGAATVVSENTVEDTKPLPTDLWSLVGYTINKMGDIFLWLLAIIIGLPMLLTYLMPNGETRSLKKIVKESVTNAKNKV